MADQTPAEGKFHVLLIGVDNYPGHLLKGCVNDVDAIRKVLVGPRMRIPEDQIRCLVSPLPDAERTPVAGEQDASGANILRELQALGSPAIAAGDRVFIYYSGHGKRFTGEPGVSTFCREALVPSDFEAAGSPGFLYDFQVNQLLGTIVQRTRSVTVILDCCHGAGATRAAQDRRDSAIRALPESTVAQDPAIGALPTSTVAEASGQRAAVAADGRTAASGLSNDACQFVSACLAYELAKETDQDGVRHGLLTRSFLAALDALPDRDLRPVTWAQIWRAMRAEVTVRNPLQTPSLEGYLGRAVFAGPPVHGDPGIPVVRDGDRYRLWAGSMAEITEGAELAVYGDLPLYFPALGSKADRGSRLGAIRVAEAQRSEAVADPIEAPFPIPPGARGRVIKGAPLRCAVIPPNPELVTALDESPLLKLVAPEAAQVRVELHGDRWYVVDDQFGTGPGTANEAPVLVEPAPTEIQVVRDVLEHYHRYSLPLRVAQRAAAAKPGGLELFVKRCDVPGFDAAKVDVQTLPDAPPGPGGIYRIADGSPLCFYARNHTEDRLHVALFDVSGSGEVQKLDDQTIDPGDFHVFWYRGNRPYPMWLEDATPCSRDRLLVIGRTSLYPLDYLAVSQTFVDVVTRRAGDDRRAGDRGGLGSASTEVWAADQKVIEIFKP
jgi:hypothetical protein